MNKPKRVTIKDIAELADVSIATASLVLNGRGKELRVSPATRARVLAIAQQQQYQPNIHARSLRDDRSRILTLGLVIPEMTNHGFATFSFELETRCREAGLQLIISCTDENPGQETMVVNNMFSRQVDGIIVASSMHNDAYYQKLSEQIPVVLFDRNINNSSLPLVSTDAISAVKELITPYARQSPDEIYFFGGPLHLSSTQERLEGFSQGLAGAGVSLKPEWIVYGHSHPSAGYEMFAGLCAQLGRPPRALFTASSGLLDGVLRYLSQHRLTGSDFLLASFDDHYLYDALAKPVDTIQQDYRQLASHCFTLINQLIQGEKPELPQRYLAARLKRRTVLDRQ